MGFAFVFVTYNPTIDELRNNLLKAAQQADRIVVVDNHSDNIAQITECVSVIDKGDLIALSENKGVGFALNVGLEFADAHKMKWLITMDQDTQIPENMVAEFRKFTDQKNIGILCPRIKYGNNPVEVQEDPFITVDKCITSGSCLNVEIACRIGGFDSTLFIDYVDYDYCAQLNVCGYTIIRIRDLVLDHSLGSSKKVRAFWGSKRFVTTYNHSPQRTYYFTRNSLYYVRKYRQTIAVGNEIKEIVKWLLIKIIYEPNKAGNTKAIAKGIVHGMTRRTDNDN